MIKDKNSLHEENIHFTYNVEFSKFLCETNKEKIEDLQMEAYKNDENDENEYL